MMRNIAVLGSGFHDCRVDTASVRTVSMEGIAFRIGCIHTPRPAFDPFVESHFVLVRKTTFSLNFRDQRSILLAAVRGARGYYVIGSDFCGEVVAVGGGVRTLKPGDRVVGNSNFQYGKSLAGKPGLSSAHASREFEVLHAAKLMKIPQSMPDEVAGAFTVGAQTSRAMIRRLRIRKGGRVLITAARSNTALFCILFLRELGCDVYAASSSCNFDDRLLAIGAKRVIRIARNQSPRFTDDLAVRELCTNQGGFDYAIDPFFDVYFPAVLEVMAKGGKYITCGMLNQYSDLLQPNGFSCPQPGSFWDVRQTALLLARNLQLMGNCIGTTEDLRGAICAYEQRALKIPIDSVWSGPNEIAAFFERTFLAPDRFGKVVYRYA